MSQEWVDLVRLGFEALQRGDMAAFDGMTTPDLVLVQPPEVPDAKTYEGQGAVAASMEDWPNQWEDFRMDLIEVVDAGDEVAVSVTRHRGRGRESGIEMDFEVFYLQRGRNGKLARVEMFFNREQAFEAAGLRE
jgi:ketosteroid isomerase-like protein